MKPALTTEYCLERNTNDYYVNIYFLRVDINYSLNIHFIVFAPAWRTHSLCLTYICITLVYYFNSSLLAAPDGTLQEPK